MAQLLGGSTVGNYLILSKGNHYNLEHHDDVNITSIADGEILTWDNTNSYWKNETLAEAGILEVGAIGNATLTLNTSGTGLSGSQTFTANATSGATFTVTSNATNANTASTIVARDASGNFSAGTITASLTGIASQVNVQDHTSNNIEYPVVWHNNTSSLYDTVSKFTFNPSTGALTATGGFIGNLTGTASNASSATWADTVDVNTSDSATWYNMVWHSGGTLYSSTGVQYQGSTDSIRLADNSHLYLGAGNDINIYHSGDTSYILNSTGTLVFGTVGSTAIYFNTVDTTRWLLGTTGDLYPNGTNTYNLGTSSYRVATVYADAFNGRSLELSNDTAGYVLSISGDSNATTPSEMTFYDENGESSMGVFNLVCKDHASQYNGDAGIYLNPEEGWSIFVGSASLTGGSGVITFLGDLVPYADSSYDIGTSSIRPATIYTDTLNARTLFVEGNSPVGIYDTNGDAFCLISGDASTGTITLGDTDGVNNGTLIEIQMDNELIKLEGGDVQIPTLSSNRVLISDANSYISQSLVTDTELGYLDGVTSSVQTQLNGKSSSTHKHKFMYSHNYTIPSDLEAGDLVGFFVPVMSGTTVKVTEVRYQTLSGTATITLKKNGTGLTGFTSMSVTTTATSTDASDQTLADNDFLNIDIDSTSSGQDLTVSIFMEVEVTTCT